MADDSTRDGGRTDDARPGDPFDELPPVDLTDLFADDADDQGVEVSDADVSAAEGAALTALLRDDVERAEQDAPPAPALATILAAARAGRADSADADSTDASDTDTDSTDELAARREAAADARLRRAAGDRRRRNVRWLLSAAVAAALVIGAVAGIRAVSRGSDSSTSQAGGVTAAAAAAPSAADAGGSTAAATPPSVAERAPAESASAAATSAGAGSGPYTASSGSSASGSGSVGSPPAGPAVDPATSRSASGSKSATVTLSGVTCAAPTLPESVRRAIAGVGTRDVVKVHASAEVSGSSRACPAGVIGAGVVLVDDVPVEVLLSRTPLAPSLNQQRASFSVAAADSTRYITVRALAAGADEQTLQRIAIAVRTALG